LFDIQEMRSIYKNDMECGRLMDGSC
jgi:hypothetical protein